MHAPVAQLDRASDFGSEGRGFESLRARHVFNDLRVLAAVSAESGNPKVTQRIHFNPKRSHTGASLKDK